MSKYETLSDLECDFQGRDFIHINQPSINNILHLVLECLVPHHLGPQHQEPEYDHLLVVQSSGVDILVHDFSYNNQINLKYLKFCYQIQAFDINHYFKVFTSKIFLHFL